MEEELEQGSQPKHLLGGGGTRAGMSLNAGMPTDCQSLQSLCR